MTEQQRVIGEVEGLRALAVASVVLFHAGFGMSGGYVGVDVFFVVSGFLITRLLCNSLESPDGLQVLDFYARRARRLLPAAGVVLVAALVATRLLSNPLAAHSASIDVGAAALLVANIRFAVVGRDYLTSSLPPSVVQHWWSLAIEEQFYLVWPAILAVAHRWGRRRAIVSVTLVLTVLSLWIGIHLTDTSPTWAYFAPWSRAWELLLGASCALLWRHRRRAFGIIGWIGVGSIVIGALTFDRHTNFPGTAALLPTLGTVAVLMSIDGDRSTRRLLSMRPLQWLGSRSYTLYLWHWPVLVLLRERVASPGVAWRIGAVCAALVLAEVTTRTVEQPIRRHQRLVRSSGWSLTVGAVAIVASLVTATIVAADTSTVGFDTGYVAPTLVPTASPSTPPPPSSSGATPATVSTTSVPVDTTPSPEDALRLAEHTRAGIVAASVGRSLLPDNITPRLDRQATDTPVLYRDGCLVGYGAQHVPPCDYGDRTSRTTIVLFGDSHAAQWFPGVEAAAIAQHWHVVVITKMGCPGLALPVTFDHDVAYPDCRAWQPAAIARVESLHPTLVVMGDWRAKYDEEIGGQSVHITDERWTSAFTDIISSLIASGTHVLLPSDAPIARTQVDQCLAAHPRAMTHCELPRARSIDQHQVDLLRAIAQHTGAMFHDTSSWFCTDSVCPPVVDNLAVYLNDNHIGATYGASLSELWVPLIEAALR